jgi:hypothetical protein
VEEEELEQALMRLYELGLVSVEYDENLEARFRITDTEKLQALIETLEEGQKDV